MKELEINAVDTVARSEAFILNLGLQPPNQPDVVENSLPSNLADLTSDELHNLHARFTSWLVFIDYEETKCKIELTILKAKLDYEGAKTYMLSERRNVSDKKEEKLTSEDFLELQKKTLVCEGRYAMLGTVRKRYESYIFAVSRRLSTLQGERNAYGGKAF